MVEAVGEKPDVFDAWLASALDFDVANAPKKVAPQATHEATHQATHQAAAAPGGGGPPAKKGGKEAPELGHQTNPFDAPEVRVEVEKLALPKVQELAAAQALNARNDFEAAIRVVEKNKKAKLDAEEAKREMIITLVVTLALMPAGPVIEAAAAGLSGSALREQIGGIIANSAPAMEKKFGAAGVKAADKAFNFVASEQVGKLAENFDAAKAKSALEAGIDKLKDKTVKFAASSNKAESVGTYLEALLKSANDSMHNLTDVIHTTSSLSAAVGYYNLFSMKLQSVYEAVLSQQVDDMLSELNDAIVQHGEEQVVPMTGENPTMSLDEIVSIDYRGRLMLAHVNRMHSTLMIQSLNKPQYGFVKWVTPDMQETAIKMVKEHLSMDAFKGQHVPDPQLEPGERVIMATGGPKARLMLITVEDKNGWFSTDYGVCTFKEWADADDERPFKARGAIQNGGITSMALRDIKDVPKA